MNRVLLIGWDAADWKVIRPLLDAGQMPNLARFIKEGVHGNLATIYPALSPMLWTSIATGKRAYKHGIHGFSEPLPDGSAVRPISILSRKTKAVWNILNQNGLRSIVVGWWPSHPAEPINGVMVSDQFHVPVGSPEQMPPLFPGTVHPHSLSPRLADLRINPMELDGDFIRLFVPEFGKVDQEHDKRLHTLGKIIAETMTVHSAGTDLLSSQPWDFAAIYYSGIDHFGHAFMRYHPPRLPWITEQDFAIYQHVLTNAYRYHDAMLGTLLKSGDENTTVVLLSDHGFHPDHLRPGYIPAEPAGPAIEHRHFGIICCKGPGLRANERLYGAGLLDICPTILTLFGLPPGKDMDGKVLVTMFKQPPQIDPIESWDQVPGDSGMHPEGARIDPVASAQAFKQLVDLGYVAPPAANSEQAVAETVRELGYNLARSYRDGNRCGKAAELAEELWAAWPKEHRFGILLIDCLGELQEVSRRHLAIEKLGHRIENYRDQAAAELEQLKTRLQNADEPEKRNSNTAAQQGLGVLTKVETDSEKARLRYEERQLRELASGWPLIMDWFLLTQALLEKRMDEARIYAEKLRQSGASNDLLNQNLAGAMVQLGERDGALSLLEKVLQSDPENPVVHSQLAAMHYHAGRFDQAIASASESLSLLYFQPGIHALLGGALMKCNRFSEAEQELHVAVAQSPRNLSAHEWLAQLYREHLDHPGEAFAHEGRALSLRNERAFRTRNPVELGKAIDSGSPDPHCLCAFPNIISKFGPIVDLSRIITVVSGLPRSGTSMMMQLLAAAGREPLTDFRREADEDNPRGYFEFDRTLEIAKDNSWLPMARGKIIKVVAQLLPFLPATENYQIIFMQRDLKQVIASQNAMLARRGLRGAGLNEEDLGKTYKDHLNRVRDQICKREGLRILSVDFNELLANPRNGLSQIKSFLGEPFAEDRALDAIRPELRRQGIE